MEEKDPNLPKELCSLGFVLWVSFSLLSYYPVLRETYTPPGFATIRNLSKFPVVLLSCAQRNLQETMRETTRQLCLRAAQQQAGASPVTAVAIGSGNAALVG